MIHQNNTRLVKEVQAVAYEMFLDTYAQILKKEPLCSVKHLDTELKKYPYKFELEALTRQVDKKADKSVFTDLYAEISKLVTKMD
jgi:hypothetical protein